MIITIHRGEDFHEALARAGVSFDCGGNGSCGKCRLRVLSGNVCVTDADRAFFDENQLAEGWRLGCRLTPVADESIEVEIWQKTVHVNSDRADASEGEMPNENVDCGGEASSRDYSFAIDIGTTTIAIAAVDMADGKVFDTFTCMNSQRQFGADVVSRIVASNNGFGPKLRELVIEDINRGIGEIMSRNGLTVETLEKIVIAGNTAMEHIFAGYSCEGLGLAPFEPVTLDEIETPSGLLLLGISAYVGADVLAGMAGSGCFDGRNGDGASGKAGDLTLFVDLGTNGEMALGNSKRILVASTAAGPAFEGGNISCGTAAVTGAVCDVELCDEDDREPIMLGLIGDEGGVLKPAHECEPAGLCGSGVIALTAELLDEGIVDETGLIDERLRGKIRLGKRVVFTQKDIRELQLAKAAVRAGIETLIHEYGADYGDIGRVLIAGSFGRALDVKKAARIGLVPAELANRCEAVGNSALDGVVKCLVDSSARDRMKAVKEVSEEIVLADNDFFAGRFIECMNF